MRARPAASALVSFVRYEDDLEMRADSTHGPTVARYVALVRNGNLAPALVPLGRASEIDSLVAAWRSEAAHYPESLVRKLRDAEYRRVGSALRERTWDALQPALRGARQVFIVGDGALCLVHWGTLPEPDGRYLIESPLLIHSLVAERDLLLQADPAPTGGLLALGDPDFDRAGVEVAVRPTTVALRGQRSNCVAFRSRRWTALPATSLEVRDVLARWRKSSRRANASGAAEYGAADTVLTGDRATEAAFKQLAAGHRVLHLATHGFFVEGECASSGSTNREGDFDRRNGALEPRRIAVENPLLLSGLVLAGANRRDSTAINADDGVLTAEEVAALDLRGVEWAVLSACETGLGELRPGEGVFGLRRAFEIAGARTVIMSLWPVDDAKTREWMAELYRARFEKGVSTGEAVRAAALAMLHRQRAHEGTTHPANWGAFVSAGDWK